MILFPSILLLRVFSSVVMVRGEDIQVTDLRARLEDMQVFYGITRNVCDSDSSQRRLRSVSIGSATNLHIENSLSHWGEQKNDRQAYSSQKTREGQPDNLASKGVPSDHDHSTSADALSVSDELKYPFKANAGDSQEEDNSGIIIVSDERDGAPATRQLEDSEECAHREATEISAPPEGDLQNESKNIQTTASKSAEPPITVESPEVDAVVYPSHGGYPQVPNENETSSSSDPYAVEERLKEDSGICSFISNRVIFDLH